MYVCMKRLSAGQYSKCSYTCHKYAGSNTAVVKYTPQICNLHVVLLYKLAVYSKLRCVPHTGHSNGL